MPNKYTVTTFGVSFGQNKMPYTHTYLCTPQANRPFIDTVKMCGKDVVFKKRTFQDPALMMWNVL